MNWRAKVAVFKLLSAIPGGRGAYRLLQQRVTKSLIPTRARVGQKLDAGISYLRTLEQLGEADRILRGVHLDFGTGWHPTIPLLFYSLGMNRQYLFDVSSLLDQRMVEGTLRTVVEIFNDPAWPHRHRLRRLPPPIGNTSWRTYFDQLGMTYCAPYDDVFPSLKGSIDLVTATQVLYCIPKDVLPGCFEQIHSGLKEGGFFMAPIHLREFLGSMQSDFANYGHLRYSTATWERWINSSLMAYNRFKAPDYRKLLETTGFVIRAFDVQPGTAEDLAVLERIPIAPCFQSYSRPDLAARDLFFAAQKPR